MNIVYVILGILLLLWTIRILHTKSVRKNKRISVLVENCTGCRRCVKRCRHRVLDMQTKDAVTHVTIKNPDKCSVCGDCIGVCKFKALQLVSCKTDS